MTSPDRTYDSFLHAIRESALDGQRDTPKCVDDYQFEHPFGTAGPNKAIAVIGFDAVMRVEFRVPVEELPDGYVFTFPLTRSGLEIGPLGDEDPPDPLTEALDNPDTLAALIWPEIENYFSFKTKAGLKGLTQHLSISDWHVWLGVVHREDEFISFIGTKLMASFTVRLICDEPK